MVICSRKKILIPIVTAFLAACSSDPTPPPMIAFDITADYQANDGRLFYCVVRTANEKQFMLDNYQEVANKAFADPPDPGVLGVFSIAPGTEQTYTVNQPAQGAMGLYFLFTQPNSQWKKLLSTPFEEKYNVELKDNGEVVIKADQSWF